MTSFTILPGLPATGPPATYIGHDGKAKHREGLVIQFNPESEFEWTANFEGGEMALDSHPGACQHPDGKRVIVLSDGMLYFVEPKTREVEVTEERLVSSILPCPEMALVFIGTASDVIAIGPEGIAWEQRNIAMDFIFVDHVEGSSLHTSLFNPNTERCEYPIFDIQTGRRVRKSFLPDRLKRVFRGKVDSSDD